MIARLWRGWTSRENADAYERLLRERVLPGLKRLDGYRGGYILRQESNQEGEFVVMNSYREATLLIKNRRPSPITQIRHSR